jgi:GNAT superfamily N-acetyltransferase
MRAQEFVQENKQATAQQVLSYIDQTHHKPLTSKLVDAVSSHPRWELRQVPLQNLYIPDQDYEDPEQEPPRDPYDRVMAVDPEHASEYSTQAVDRHPIVVDDQGYIIDGNHRAWAAAELLNRDSIPAWIPVKQSMAEYRKPKVQQANRDGVDLTAHRYGNELTIDADTHGRNLARVVFNVAGQTLVARDLLVDEAYRGQGIAAVMYDYAKELGYRVERSGEQTDAGKSFWDKNRGKEATVWENFADGNSMSTKDMAEGQHQHTEIIKWPVGDWIVYLDNHSVIRAMTRNIGPRMMSNLLNMVSTIPNLEDKVPKNGAFWIQDIKTNSSFYFRRLDIPSEPLAVRCETGVQDVPRANKNTPVFRVNAYTGPETPKDIQGMKQAKLRSKFVGTNVMASNLAANIQKGHLGSDDVIRNPATQDSKRYDRAFKQAQQMDKEVDENFADGKVKGKSRPGRVKRAGASCNGSVTDLRARAKRASGEKAKMYHWCANMKSGKKK